MEIQTTSIDIVQIIMEIVISNYSLIKNNEIEINNRLPEKQIKIYGEEIICKRIIQNLISNSHKDVPPGISSRKDNNNGSSSSVRVKRTRI